MAVLPAAIKERFPSFAELPDPAIEAHIKKVTKFECPEGMWEEEEVRDEGITLCVAHFLTLELIQQAMIASVSTGVSKGNPPNSIGQLSGKNHWDLTVYGLQYRDFQRSMVPITGFAFGYT